MIVSSSRPAARLLFALLLFALLPVVASSQQKRPLRHSDYDGWRSIQGQQLSRDGKFLSYSLVPQEGEAELVVRNLATGTEHRQNLGGRASPTEGGDAAASPGEGFSPFRAARTVYTPDNRFLVFSLAPTKAELDAARKAKKKPEEMPRPGIGIMDLSNGKVTRVERVKSFQVPEEGPSYVAYLLEAKPEKPEEKKPDDKKPEEKKPEEKKTEEKKGEEEAQDQPQGPPATTPGAGRFGGARSARGPSTPTKVYGTDLIIRNLSGSGERTVPDVLEFHWTKDGKNLVYIVSSKVEEKNGIYVLTTGSAATATPVMTGKGKYTRLTWDEKQMCLAFLSDRDEAANPQPRYKLYCWERKLAVTAVASLDSGANGAAPAGVTAAALAAELVSTATPGFQGGMVVSERAVVSFSQDGSRLFLGVAPAPPPPPKDEKKDGDTSEPPAEKVVLDLWHWKDDYIQPMQKIRAAQEQNRTFRAVYHIKDKKFVQLADTDMPELLPCPDGRFALASTDRPYRMLVGHDTSYSDYCVVNTTDGSRKPILKKQQWNLTWAPGGKYCLYYDGKDWNSLAVEDNIIVNLTKNLGVKFFNEDHDTPNTPFGYGVAGWTKDDKHVLLYDRYDVWQIAPDGSGARNLTGGLGRQQKVRFRLVRLDVQERTVDTGKPLLLQAENESTRDSGFYRLRPDGSPELLLMQARSFGPLQKAKDADVLVLTASTFNEFSDLLVTTSEFKDLKKVTNANPQKAELVWGTAEMVRYKNADGVPLSGVLVKPENFDPNKKYPLLVYIYERLSQGLHRFVNPSPGTSINVSYYVSNGYLVLMPDITYTVGYPGQSALKCVLPAIQAVVDKGCVDEKAIGIQGHSWGGYQIAYMVTQTNRFKAASAGAPVANMISAYDGIRWGTGLPRQFQYERTQSRIGGSLWQYPMRFVENSPIFMADRVQTPVMMLHNDQDDAVPWYQGIEYFLALRRLGKEVYLFNYNGEFHGLRKRVNQKDYTVRLQQFFDHYLKGAQKPEWMEKGIPYQPPARDAGGGRPAAGSETQRGTESP